MSNQKRNILYIALLIVGVVLYAAGSLGYIDSFWSGMGGAIIGVSAVRLVLSVKYKKDPKYAKYVDISNEDERTQFIADKARSWALRFSIFLLCGLGIILRPMGHVAESQMCFYAVCGMEVIYLSCRAVVNRKY